MNFKDCLCNDLSTAIKFSGASSRFDLDIKVAPINQVNTTTDRAPLLDTIYLIINPLIEQILVQRRRHDYHSCSTWANTQRRFTAAFLGSHRGFQTCPTSFRFTGLERELNEAREVNHNELFNMSCGLETGTWSFWWRLTNRFYI